MRKVKVTKRMLESYVRKILTEGPFEAALERELAPTVSWERFSRTNEFLLSGQGSQNFVRMILDEVEVSSPRIGDLFEEMITSPQGAQIQRFLLDNTSSTESLGNFVFNSNDYDNNSAFSDMVLGAANSNSSIFPTKEDMTYNRTPEGVHQFSIKPFLVSAKASFSSAGGSFLSAAYGNSNIHIHTAAVMCAYIASRYLSQHGENDNITIRNNDDVNLYVNLGGISLVPTVSLKDNDLEALGSAIYEDTKTPTGSGENTQKVLSIQGYSSYVTAENVLITLKGRDIKVYSKFMEDKKTAKTRIQSILKKASNEDLLSLIVDNATDRGAGLIEQQKQAILRIAPFIRNLLQQSYNNITTPNIPMETVNSLAYFISSQIADEKKTIVRSSIEQHLSSLNMQDILEYYDFIFDEQRQPLEFASELNESTSIQLHPIHKLRKKYLKNVTLKGQAKTTYESFEENVMARVMTTLPIVKLQLNIKGIPNIKAVSSETGLKTTLEKMEVLSRLVDVLTMYGKGQPLPERLQINTTEPVDFRVNFGMLEDLAGGQISNEFVTAVVRKLAQRYFTGDPTAVPTVIQGMFKDTEIPTDGLTKAGLVSATTLKAYGKNKPKPDFDRVFNAASKDGKVNSKSIQNLLVRLLTNEFQSQEYLYKSYVSGDLSPAEGERSAISEIRNLLSDISSWFKTSFFKIDKTKILSVVDAVREAFNKAIQAIEDDDNSVNEVFGVGSNQLITSIQNYFKNLLAGLLRSDLNKINNLTLDIENLDMTDTFAENFKQILQNLLQKLKVLDDEDLDLESKLYESILNDLLEASLKKNRKIKKSNKVKLTKYQLQELLQRQLK